MNIVEVNCWIITGQLAHQKVNVDDAKEKGEMQLKAFRASWPSGFYGTIKKEVVPFDVKQRHILIGGERVFDEILNIDADLCTCCRTCCEWARSKFLWFSWAWTIHLSGCYVWGQWSNACFKGQSHIEVNTSGTGRCEITQLPAVTWSLLLMSLQCCWHWTSHPEVRLMYMTW